MDAERQVALKAVKPFVYCYLLTQLYLHLKFPDWILPLFLFFKLSVLPVFLLAWVSLHHTVVICLLVTCSWKTFYSGKWCCCSLALSGWGGQFQATLNFPKKLSNCEQRESFPQPWLGVNSLPNTGFTLGTISSAFLHFGSSTTGLLSFKELLQTLLVRWGWKTLHNRWGCDPAPCLGVGRLGPKASKTPHLSIWIRHICTLLSSLVRVCSKFPSANKQTSS